MSAAKVLAELVEELVDPDPCSYDHHGLCQAHSLHEAPCPHQRAKDYLAGMCHICCEPRHEPGALYCSAAHPRPEVEEQACLRWACTSCGWSVVVPMPGYAGDGHYHYNGGNPESPCGPLVATREGFIRARPGESLGELTHNPQGES